MRIYTKTGDRGLTGLYATGERVNKFDPLICLLGEVDELNCKLGEAFALVPALATTGGEGLYLLTVLNDLQKTLMCLGADLATPREREGAVRITEQDVLKLEKIIDRREADLAPLRTFILPGGHTVGAALHSARTICRRAEREAWLVYSHHVPNLNTLVIVFLNRLSDLLFVLARWTNQQAGILEQPWIPS
jgi:cob(I)alamin adenosyltransferase